MAKSGRGSALAFGFHPVQLDRSLDAWRHTTRKSRTSTGAT
jgi:hypothetical protein